MSLDLSKVDAIFATHAGQKGALIPILQEVQEAFGYVPAEAVNYVSEKLNISPSKIFGVLSFYSQFRLKPCGRNILRVCCGTACHVQGGAQILEGIKQELQINANETTADGKFTLQEVNCVGACGIAPVIIIGPKTFGLLNAANALNAVRKFEG